MKQLDFKKLHMYEEIHQQADAVKITKKINLDKIKLIAKKIKEKNITNVVLSARGSSDNVCVYFKYMCEIFAGLPCGFAAPSVSTVYGGKLNYKNTLVIGVSQSGQGLDILNVIEEAKKAGALTIAITNYETSLLAQAADYHLYLGCGVEKSVAATKTFITEMYVLGLMCAEIANSDYLRKNLDLVPSLLKETLKEEENIFNLAKSCVDMYDCYFLARGINYVSVLESALKLQETTYVKSKAYSVSDFYHGPFAVVDDTQNIFLLHGFGRCNMNLYEMFEKLMDAKANVYVISNDSYFTDYSKTLFVPRCEECISPFAIIEAMQIFSCFLSVLKGNNPDIPRGLKKVTVTR